MEDVVIGFGNVKNEVQKTVILQLSMIFDLFCVHLHLHFGMHTYLLNRSRITTSKRYEQKNIHWERAHNGADLSHSIFGLW